MVTFHCELNETGNLLLWLVNDGIANSEANSEHSVLIDKIHNRVSTLTIRAYPWNNNVEIQCAFRPDTSISVDCNNPTVTCSRKAILRIQGT